MADNIFGISIDDLLTMSKTIYGEARGEPDDGKIAVGWVIRNRFFESKAFHQAHPNKPKWWGTTIKSICLSPNQFSCWNLDDPNRAIILPMSIYDLTMARCYQPAKNVVNGVIDDNTFGATSYKVTSLPWPHHWGDERPALVTHGHHSFYNLETQV